MSKWNEYVLQVFLLTTLHMLIEFWYSNDCSYHDWLDRNFLADLIHCYREGYVLDGMHERNARAVRSVETKHKCAGSKGWTSDATASMFVPV